MRPAEEFTRKTRSQMLGHGTSIVKKAHGGLINKRLTCERMDVRWFHWFHWFHWFEVKSWFSLDRLDGSNHDKGRGRHAPYMSRAGRCRRS